MRTLVQLDLKIPKDECLALLDDYADFIKEHTGIECEFYVERKDFSQVPTSPDSDGDLKPTRAYLKALEKEVHTRYRDYGVDNIVLFVHEENFTFRGIWGSNFSYYFNKYSTQLCRWDKDNSANTFGTLNHEIMHSFDAVVLKETGINLDLILGLDYDKFIVHGGRPDKVNTTEWKYVNHQQNTKALKTIAPYLLRAYAVRKEKHDKDIGLLTQIVKLLSTLVSLLLKRKWYYKWVPSRGHYKSR